MIIDMIISRKKSISIIFMYDLDIDFCEKKITFPNPIMIILQRTPKTKTLKKKKK
jgi:hypothetical protein